MPFGSFQYQALTEPVSTQPESVTEDRWHRPWSEPVRYLRDPRAVVALIASGLYFCPQTLGELITVDKWFAYLSEPVRFKGVFPGLPAADQLAFTTSPVPFVPFGWFGAMNEPIVKARPALRTSAQPSFTISAQPFVPFSWFRPQTELPPPGKVGLSARLQQFLAAPPRLLPTPNITGTMSALETKDGALFGGITYNRPVTVIMGLPVVSLPSTW